MGRRDFLKNLAIHTVGLHLPNLQKVIDNPNPQLKKEVAEGMDELDKLNQPTMKDVWYLTIGSSITILDMSWTEAVKYIIDNKNDRTHKFKISSNSMGTTITRTN